MTARSVADSLIADPLPRRGRPNARSAHRRSLCGCTGHHAHDVVAELGRGHLVPAQLAAESGVQAEPAAEVDLETLDLVAVGVGDDLALETDVGDLDAGAGVRAAALRWTVIGPSRSISGQPLLELVHQPPGAGPSSRRWRACRTRCPCRPSRCAATATGGPAGRPRPRSAINASTADGTTSSTDDLLQRQWIRMRRLPVPLGSVGRRQQGLAGDPAGHRREADVVPTVTAARARRRGRCGATAIGAAGRRAAGSAGTRSPGPARNCSAPQSATRNLIRARLRSRRYP